MYFVYDFYNNNNNNNISGEYLDKSEETLRGIKTVSVAVPPVRIIGRISRSFSRRSGHFLLGKG